MWQFHLLIWKCHPCHLHPECHPYQHCPRPESMWKILSEIWCRLRNLDYHHLPTNYLLNSLHQGSPMTFSQCYDHRPRLDHGQVFHPLEVCLRPCPWTVLDWARVLELCPRLSPALWIWCLRPLWVCRSRPPGHLPHLDKTNLCSLTSSRVSISSG